MCSVRLYRGTVLYQVIRGLGYLNFEKLQCPRGDSTGHSCWFFCNFGNFGNYGNFVNFGNLLFLVFVPQV